MPFLSPPGNALAAAGCFGCMSDEEIVTAQILLVMGTEDGPCAKRV